MSEQTSDVSRLVWDELVAKYIDSNKARVEFFRLKKRFLSEDIDYINTLRHFLRSGTATLALEVCENLVPDELVQLFPELIALCCENGPNINEARALILRLPHEWVLQHIEEVVEPLLQSGSDWEYARVLELYNLLDQDLTHKLALRASKEEAPYTREVGMFWLE